MYAKLPKFELVFYFCYWLALFSKMVYHFYTYCRVLEKNEIFNKWALTRGFFFSFPYREKLDSDILVMFEYGISFAVLGMVHVILRRILFNLLIPVGARWRDSALLIFMTLYGIFGLIYVVGYNFGLFQVGLAVLNWLVVQKVLGVLPITKAMSPLARAWIVAIVQTFCLHYYMDYFDQFSISRLSQIAFIWSLGWYQLRLISFTDFNLRYQTSFLHFLGYVFYFPILFAPFASYTRFLIYNELKHECEEDHAPRSSFVQPFSTTLKLFVKQYLYIFMWTLLTIFANHAFYPTAVAFYQEVYLQSDLWARAGHAWLMGQWFQAKYMILYGVPWIIAFLDTGLPLPEIPVFISRIYRYSVMWRRFDTGLYEFMRDHLYGPSLATLEEWIEWSRTRSVLFKSATFQRMLALAATYAFVGIWHGLNSGALMFAAMNYVGLIAEFVTSGISRKMGLEKKLSPLWYRRLSAFICAFGVQWSWISFFYFMTNRENGYFIVHNLFYHPFHLYVFAFIAMYSWVHLSIELEMWLDPPKVKASVQQAEQPVQPAGQTKKHSKKQR